MKQHKVIPAAYKSDSQDSACCTHAEDQNCTHLSIWRYDSILLWWLPVLHLLPVSLFRVEPRSLRKVSFVTT